MKRRVAGVCLLENPYYIDGVYDYEIPPEIKDLTVGRLVTVPFGMRNRLCVALVTEIRDHSAYKELKMIRALCPESLSLDDEALGLCAFLKKKTLCSTGEAVRAMLPVAALSRLEELCALSPAFIKDNSDEIPSSDLFVYEFLRDHGETDRTMLRNKLGIRAERSLSRLKEMGAVETRILFREAKEGKTERFWSLAVSKETARALANGEECDDIKLTSMGHKSILSVLIEEDAPMSAPAITALTSTKPAQIKALEAKGLLLCEEKQTNRNPYTDAPYVGQTPQTLNREQQAALDTLLSLTNTGDAKAALLHGVTGSGKTRVMTALIDSLLEQGKGVILLLPEIALTPQSVSIFCSRYGRRVAVMHSALSAGERYDAFCRIRRGDADVVIGTRSAIFAPVKNLGAIIIDEEQEHTYKSDQDPKYHAKDIARFRCAHHKALMLLASATPSVESYKKAQEGAYTLLTLTERYGDAKLPEVSVVDMRLEAQNGNTSELSDKLVLELKKTLERGEQAILFLNRRGYNRAVTCRTCGKPLTCPRCSVALTYHTRRGSYREGEMRCHWCGIHLPLPTVCPECSSEHLAHMGFGTQKIEEELAAIFPSARILRMDADTTSHKASYEAMLGKFRRQEADILLGTQMVTKGHDFHKVTLVGVLLADASLYLEDYRAAERTFAMLTQVIGRAGRGALTGRAVIQTNNPDSDVIRLACAQDYPRFYEREIRLRRLLCFPPICDLALVTVSSQLESNVLLAATRLTAEINELRALPAFADMELVTFGPFEAPVYRVDNRYRMRMVIKCKLTSQTLQFFHTLLCRFGMGCGKKVTIGVDFNPSNL